MVFHKALQVFDVADSLVNRVVVQTVAEGMENVFSNGLHSLMGRGCG